MQRIGMLCVALAACGQYSGVAQTVVPAAEKWTESTAVKGEFGWGNYEGSQTAIGTDEADKKTGKVSIKYSGIHNKAGGALGPALIFSKDRYLDISALAGGRMRFDVKLGDAANFQYLQLVLMSDGVQAHQVNRNLKLQPGWNHIEVPLAAKGSFREAGWKGSRAREFDPAAIHQIRFRLIYLDDKKYDSAKPRDVWFDGVQFVAAASQTPTAQTPTAQTPPIEILERKTVAAEHKIAPGQSWKVELPRLERNSARLLRVRVRREAPQLSGYGAYLYLAMNGEPLDAARNRYVPRLLNKPLAFTRPGGQEVFWNRGDGIWQTIFAPDFETSFKRYGPGVAEPYTYLLDVSDLARPDGSNEVELSSFIPETSDGEKIALVVSVDWIAARVPASRAAESTRPAIAALPKLAVTPTGALQLALDSRPLTVESYFSVPGGGRNRLGGASREAAWQPQVTQLDAHRWRIEAAGAHYRLTREIVQSQGRIAVRDRFQNLTGQEIGIIFSNELNLADQPGINFCRIGGQRGQGINEVLSRENPTLFFPLRGSSLTLVAEDDVYRNQAVFYFDTETHRSGIRDAMFALAPRAEYSVEWSLYTLPDAEYFSMINRVREDWKSNISLQGPIYFTNYRSIAAMEPAQVKELVDRLGARYICFWEISTPENQLQWDNRQVMAEGPGVWNPIFEREVELVKQATARLHAARPDIKVALYSHSFFISPEHPDDRTFQDSWITTAAGERSTSVYHSATRYPFRTVYPTLSNSYGREYMKVIDFYLNDLKLDWLYWDESNGPGVTVEQGDKLEAYLTYNAWDGHSAKIDPQTGLIRQKCGFLTLLSDEFIDAVVQKVRQHGGFVLFNGAAATQRRRRSPSFVETQWDITHAYRTDLNTPLSYGLGKPTMTDLRRRLEFGTLYARTHLDYGSSAVTHFYPFTPLELHEGWVKGRERIVTNRSGNFGWDAQPFTGKAYLYDAAGRLQATQNINTPRTSVPLEVPPGGLAVLERTPPE